MFDSFRQKIMVAHLAANIFNPKLDWKLTLMDIPVSNFRTLIESHLHADFISPISSEDPEWFNRLSLHEMELSDALQASYGIAFCKERKTETLHSLVTRAIANMVPVERASNADLLYILFGLEKGPTGTKDDYRNIRHLRNGKRTLKIDAAALHILNLLHSELIEPAEGGRLWYVSLLYGSAITAINEFFENFDRKDRPTFEQFKTHLIILASSHFEILLEKYAMKSSSLSLEDHPKHDVRQFMDVCACIYWIESSIKRNPLIAIKRKIALAPILNVYKFPA